MSVPERASTMLQSRSFQRTCVAVAIVAAGSAAVGISAMADDHALLHGANAAAGPGGDADAASGTEPTGAPEVRRITVTPADRVDLVADPEPVDALATALAARYERLVAEAPEPEVDPAPQQAAEFATSGDETASDEDEAVAEPAPAPDAEPEPATPATTNVSLDTWEAVARCESGYGGEPDWSINTGNGYYGGLQFNLDSWRWVGGTGYPHEASKATQIEMAERLWERQGWNAWPACSRKLGLR